MIGKLCKASAALLTSQVMAGDGSSEEDAIAYIIPVGDAGLINLQVWNTVSGEYLEEQKENWRLNMKFSATYTKEAGRTYEAGMCFPMFEPFGNMVDCFTAKDGEELADSILNTDRIAVSTKDDYPLDEVSQSWEIVPVDDIDKAKERCDDDTGVCTLSV